MRRVRERTENGGDSGAVAVLFALVLVVLLGFVGAGVDLTSAYAKTQEVQNAADAAAIAVAQQCASPDACSPGEDLATLFAESNIRFVDGFLSTSTSLETREAIVVVETGHQNYFLGLFGQQSFTLREDATAVWGVPIAGKSTLPVALSRCEIGAQIDTELGVTQTILFPKKSGTDCTGTSGNFMPGGFAWLATDSGTKCEVSSGVDDWEFSDPGKSAPTACSNTHFLGLVGKTVLIPVFKDYDGTGSNAKYKVDGFVAWHLEGYFFSSSYKYNAKCSNPDQCLTGKFVRFVTLDEAWEYGEGPDFGASIVALVD